MRLEMDYTGKLSPEGIYAYLPTDRHSSPTLYRATGELQPLYLKVGTSFNNVYWSYARQGKAEQSQKTHHRSIKARPGWSERQNFADWPELRFDLASHHASGVYLGTLLSDKGRPLPEVVPGWNSHAVLFAISDRTVLEHGPSGLIFSKPSRRILYKLPIFTYAAYNRAGGASFYDRFAAGGEPGKADIPYNRPGNGVGGWADHGQKANGTKVEDHYMEMEWNKSPTATKTQRNTFGHWDLPMIRWLEDNGYEVDYCTDADVHFYGYPLLQGYDLIISAGHDEYWTLEMRESLEKFVKNGGNIAFFGGNTSYWKFKFEGGTGDSLHHKITRETEWIKVTGKEEEKFIGVSWNNGGGVWIGARPSPIQRYRIQLPFNPPFPWVFQGVQDESTKEPVTNGTQFGDQTNPPLIGYEWDGCEYTEHAGLMVPQGPNTPRHEGNTTLSILAHARVRVTDTGKGADNKGYAVIGAHRIPSIPRPTDGREHGVVFNAGTVDWPLALPDPRRGRWTDTRDNKIVEQITHNVIRSLSRSNYYDDAEEWPYT